LMRNRKGSRLRTRLRPRRKSAKPQAAREIALMNITIPIFVQSHRDTYLVRPLFFPRPIQQHEKLERVLHLLAGELRKELRDLGKALRHEDLAAWTFCPDLDYRRLDLVIELRKRLARG